MTDRQLSLSELQVLVKEALDGAFPDFYWVKAEIAEMTVNRSGHCYLDLVETTANSRDVMARVRATIWSYSFRMLKPYFESTTGQAFGPGIKILFQAKIEYHEVYGFSLNIRDVDPTYTLGDMARQRREIIRRLEEEGVLEMNKELEMPLVPQRIAVISSPTAAGLQDFTDQLHQNPQQIYFRTQLFPAVMQGREAPESIMAAMDQIFDHETEFDVVVLIRGGGAQLDLAAFDDYELAFHITQFPLPVITGIGHDKDDSVADMVAHTRMKTPTAVAEFLIAQATGFMVRLNELEGILVEMVKSRLQENREQIQNLMNSFNSSVRSHMKDERQFMEISALKLKTGTQRFLQLRKNEFEVLGTGIQSQTISFLQHRKHELIQSLDQLRFSGKTFRLKKLNKLSTLQQKVQYQATDRMKSERQRIRRLEENLRLVDPSHILKRGFSLSFVNGKLVKSTSQLSEGDILETRLADGTVESKITGNKQH